MAVASMSQNPANTGRSISKHSRVVAGQCCYYNTICTGSPPLIIILHFLTFTNLKREGLRGSSRTTRQLFLKIIYLFEYEPQDKRKLLSETAVTRQKLLIIRGKNYLALGNDTGDQPEQQRPKKRSDMEEMSLQSKRTFMNKD